jgi:gag-polyprotein putative aspartyl protease
VEKEKAQVATLKALAITMTKKAKQGSSPLEKKEQQAKLPALLLPKEGLSPQEQAEQESKFAKALTRAVIGLATAKRWRDGLPSEKKKAKEGQRGSTLVEGPAPRNLGKRRTYAEALTACKERWTRYKQGKEDVFADLPFAGQTEDPVEARKAVISGKQNALVVPITFANLEGAKEGIALVDSGATECFIDTKTAQRWGLPTRRLVYLQKIYNIDGTENKAGKITRSCMLRVRKGNKQAHQRFFITSLGNDRVILGYPWLEEFNPEINWNA